MQERKIILITFVGLFILIAVLISFISFILFLFQKKHHAFLNQLEDVKNKYEREFLNSVLEMQEQTIEHISHEIHDNIGQFLTLAKLQLNTIEPEIGSKTAEKVEYAVVLLTKALDDLRDLSKSLSLELIRSVGLAKAIESQVNQLKNTEHYEIDFEIRGIYNYFDEKKEIFIFRILQEAINNIIRHAKARSVKIVLECSQDAISMMVKDDGNGFNMEKFIVNGKLSKSSGGIGHMNARAMLIDADFFIESEPGKGTLVRITVPINQSYDPSSS
jgi:two-component system, NarL family, sensor kinase